MESFVFMFLAFYCVVLVCNIGFDSDDWFDSVVAACLIEFYCPIHCTMVSYGDWLHSQFLGLFNDVFWGAKAVKERVLGVDVEVDKVVVGHRSFYRFFTQKYNGTKRVTGLVLYSF